MLLAIDRHLYALHKKIKKFFFYLYYILLSRDILGNCYFLLAEIALKGATYQISFSDTDQLPPPFRIDNISEVRNQSFTQTYFLNLQHTYLNVLRYLLIVPF